MTEQFALDAQRMEILSALCDTIAPSIEHRPDPHGHWARSASSYGVPQGIAEAMATFPPDIRDGLCQLLDALGQQGLTRVSQLSKEQLLRNVSLGAPDAAAGIAALAGLTLMIHYGAPDPSTGRNPGWDVLGYPGPVSPPPPTPKTLAPIALEGDDLTLDADVVVVGSGAGGAVIAAELAARGASVVIVEAGGY